MMVAELQAELLRAQLEEHNIEVILPPFRPPSPASSPILRRVDRNFLRLPCLLGPWIGAFRCGGGARALDLVRRCRLGRTTLVGELCRGQPEGTCCAFVQLCAHPLFFRREAGEAWPP